MRSSSFDGIGGSARLIMWRSHLSAFGFGHGLVVKVLPSGPGVGRR